MAFRSSDNAGLDSSSGVTVTRLVGRIFTGVSVIAAVATLMLGLPSVSSAMRQSATTEGVVVKLLSTTTTSTRNHEASVACTVKYRFEVNGQTYQNISAVGSNTNCILDQGEAVQVCFNPANPNEASMASDRWFTFRFVVVFLGIATIFGVIGIWLLVFVGKSRPRRFGQARHGAAGADSDDAEPDDLQPEPWPDGANSEWPQLPRQ
jgi:hypothetical protein